MLQLWFLRVHRWLTLTLAIPLAVLILTGLVLSFEPMVQGAGGPARVTPEAIDAALTKHDSSGAARSLIIRSYAGIASIGGARRGEAIHVDLARNEAVASPETEGMAPGWTGAMMGMMTTVRVLPPDRYAAIMSRVPAAKS